MNEDKPIGDVSVIERPAQITPMELLDRAVASGADPDALAKLMDLQERYEAREAEKAYTAAMSKFHADCPIIEKTLDGHNCKYAGLAETLKQIKPLMTECELTPAWKADIGETITVTCIITHIGGHSGTSSMTAPPDDSGKKNQLQAIGSTKKYLQRYTLYDVLGLASSEHDDDGESAVGVIDAGQKDALCTALRESGFATDRLLVYMTKICEREIASLDEIPSDLFQRAMTAINKHKNDSQ